MKVKEVIGNSMAMTTGRTDSKYVKADIEVYKYGFLINGWYIHQENGGVVVEKDTERYYYTNVNLAVKHCLLDRGRYCEKWIFVIEVG